ncbi:uncharacterized protein LOC144478153 [Augochlora pura]
MNSQDSQISTLRRRRGNIIGHITTLKNFLDNCEESEHRNISLITEHLNGLAKAWDRFDDIQFELETLDPSEETRRFEMQTNYYTVVARAKDLIQPNEQPNNSRSVHPASPALTVTAPMAIKLPEMRLPTFDGTIENWASFFDIFTSMIDRNEDLTPVQKLQYLRSTLTGKAAACIQSLKTTDTNYQDAIDILKEKFHCPRRTLLRHCDAIRDIPKLTKDTPEALGELLDVLNQHLRALRNLGESVSSWNSILISIILSKINSDTIWQWEVTLPNKEMPSYTHLMEFLQKRANCSSAAITRIVSTGGNRHTSIATNPKPSTGGTARTQTFFAAKSPQCSICHEAHAVRDCETFKLASPATRLETVEKTALCHNCLRPGHTTDSCRSLFSCRVCNQRHHTLIHTSDHPGSRRSSTTPNLAKSASVVGAPAGQEDADHTRPFSPP